MLGVGDDAIRRAAEGELSGLHAIGSYLLWEAQDPARAKPYLEAAVAAESFEAALDLFVVTIFEAQYSPFAVGILPEIEFAL